MHFTPGHSKNYFLDAKNRSWKPPQRGDDSTIGQMYSAHLIFNTDCVCLRLLLIHVPGATSFEFLRTHQGVTFVTFKAAAQKRR